MQARCRCRAWMPVAVLCLLAGGLLLLLTGCTGQEEQTAAPAPKTAEPAAAAPAPTATPAAELESTSVPASAALTAPETGSPAASASLTELRFSVEGMTCQGCANSIAMAIGGMKGVESCEVSYEEKLAVVSVEDPGLASKIIEAITSLNYVVEPLEG